MFVTILSSGCKDIGICISDDGVGICCGIRTIRRGSPYLFRLGRFQGIAKALGQSALDGDVTVVALGTTALHCTGSVLIVKV